MEVGFRSHQGKVQERGSPHPGFVHLKNYFITGGTGGTTWSTRPLREARSVAGGHVEFEL